MKHRTLKPEELVNRCNPDNIPFETTEDIPPLEGTVGQERALDAIEFGLNMDVRGFNLYVAGHPGTGKNTTILDILKRRAKSEPTPDDWVYVHNFDDPLSPIALRLSPGRGTELAQSMNEVIKAIQVELPRATASWSGPAH